MSFNLKQMECDILEITTIRDGSWSIYQPDRAASKFLLNKYASEGGRDQLSVVIQYLLEERYLIPGLDHSERDSKDIVRGLTPKGYKRLRELQAPKWTWFKSNWFPTSVAAITAIAAVGSIVVDATCNRG